MHDVIAAVGVGVRVGFCVSKGGSSPSRQPPNQPGYLHDEAVVGADEVVVTVGAGAGDVLCEISVVEVSVSSLQPNQPGVLHVDVDEVVMVVVFE